MGFSILDDLYDNEHAKSRSLSYAVFILFDAVLRAVQLYRVTGMQFFAAHGADFAVYQHFALGNADLRFAAGAYQVCKFEQCIKFDEFGFNFNFSLWLSVSQAVQDRCIYRLPSAK